MKQAFSTPGMANYVSKRNEELKEKETASSNTFKMPKEEKEEVKLKIKKLTTKKV